MNRLILAFLSLVLASSCVVTDVGNPENEKVDVELEFEGYAETQTSALTHAGEASIDTAWIVLSQIRFQKASMCDEEGPSDAIEPVAVDLLADEPTYASPMFTKPAGEYCKLDVGFASLAADALPEGAPSGLAGNSVLVEGARADGVEFRIEARFDSRFHLQGALQGFKLENEHEHLIVGFALDQWLNEQKLDAVRGEDPIIINEETYPEILADFKGAVARSSRLFRDRNDNRRLDVGERGEPMAIGAENASNNASVDARSHENRAVINGQGQRGD